ncbi:S41 family peptidase [Salinibacter altiplanensis]|uniref:S41 family peptidase n=1 Tax=Salinibacter altiplanensis TaxID=1803181 RepID=UPI000C9ED742|nr:S41 family peptidase [Salinibacter altiplanensis]
MSSASTKRWLRRAVAGLVLLLGAAALTYAYRDTLGLAEPPAKEQVENVRAFAKLYGYVRYFHPSDAAAETDWDAFAIYGARKVKNASSQAELRSDLKALFKPIAPTIQLYRTGSEPPSPADVLTPADTAELNLVAWQHRGVGFPRDKIPRVYQPGADSLRAYRSIRLGRPPEREPLFEAHPAPGETVAKPLRRGLSVQLPLALHGRDGQTLRPEGAPSPSALRDSIGRVEAPVFETTPSLRLGSVAIAWNVFQHFYPYFEVVDVDWNAVLTRTLRRALADDRSRKTFAQTLRRMVAQLGDGHGQVKGLSTLAGLPVKFGRVEGNVVVVDTAAYVDRALCVEVGDVVTSIGGRSPKQELRDAKQHISGSPQWKEVRALQQFGRGEPGSNVSLTVQRGKKEKACQLRRASGSEIGRRYQKLQRENRPTPIDTLHGGVHRGGVHRGGVHYVDLTRATWPEIQDRIGGLARAERIVFDLRGYPGSSRKALQHLAADSLLQMRIATPQFIYPDQDPRAGFRTDRGRPPPRTPQITGDVAFLADARAISAPEGMLAVVKHHDLGTVVGQATAGANGGINPFELPGGYAIHWTGQRACKHDGSQHHLVGIQPDVRAERTLEGVRGGRDEVLEKGIEVLRQR